MNIADQKLYERYQSVRVPAESLDAFLDEYLLPSLMNESLRGACRHEVEHFGYCVISKHDSKTGQPVAYYVEENAANYRMSMSIRETELLAAVRGLIDNNGINLDGVIDTGRLLDKSYKLTYGNMLRLCEAALAYKDDWK